MNDEQGWKLGRQVFVVSGAFTVAVGIAAAVMRFPGLIAGYACGVAVGLLSFGSLVYLVYAAVAPVSATVSSARRQAAGIATQVLKYLVVFLVLYLLVTRFKVNTWALFAGLTTPLVIATVLALRLPLGKPLAPKNPE